jgi:hypothetical protein
VRRPYISKKLRAKVAAQSRHRCGYCLAPQSVFPIPLHIEHIDPFAEGGATAEPNLWLACPACNGHRGKRIYGRDPQTKRRVHLFNPRRQKWGEHFRLSDDYCRIIGITACGRATVEALKMNDDLAVTARGKWILAGEFPPEEYRRESERTKNHELR